MARPQMRGPGGRRGMMGGKRSKNPKKTLGRLMKYIQKAKSGGFNGYEKPVLPAFEG